MSRVLTSLAIMILAGFSYLYTDLPVAIYFQHLKGDALYNFFHAITILGQIEYYLIPALLIYLFYKKRDSVVATKAMFVFVSLSISGIIVLFIKVLGGRFRPEMYFKEDAFGFDFFHLAHTMTSFPSGHAVTAMGAAAAFSLLFSKYRLYFYLFGISIMISRVVIVRHYPSDIMIGGLIGVLTSYIVYEKYFKEKINTKGKEA